jgi:hypothetical protein
VATEEAEVGLMVAEVGLMVAEAGASMAVEAHITEAAADRIAAAVEHPVRAAPMEVRDLRAEEVTTEAAAVTRDGIWPRPGIVRPILVHRIFIPPSTMGSGILSVIPVPVLPVPWLAEPPA